MAIAKKKKKFFEVSIPLIEKETQARAFDISELNGKYIRYDLTRFLRGKATILQGKIKADKETATLVPVKLQLLHCYLSRMVRKGTNYVEDSFSTPCADSTLKLKPFLVTRKKVSRAVRKALRNKCKEELVEYVKDKSSEEIFEDILKNKLQKILSSTLKKVYPLSCCEIRIIKVENFLDKPAQKSKKPEAEKTTEIPVEKSIE
jgi:ribosomal protein S3AE